MTSTDLASSCSVRIAFSPIVVGTGAPIVGPEIDTIGYRWALVILNLGVIPTGGAAGVVRVQGADTSGGSFVNLPAAAFTILDADDNSIKTGLMDLNEFPRFLRLNGTGAATGNNLLGATMVLYGPQLPGLPDFSAGGADALTFSALTK